MSFTSDACRVRCRSSSRPRAKEFFVLFPCLTSRPDRRLLREYQSVAAIEIVIDMSLSFRSPAGRSHVIRADFFVVGRSRNAWVAHRIKRLFADYSSCMEHITFSRHNSSRPSLVNSWPATLLFFYAANKVITFFIDTLVNFDIMT